MVFAPGWPLAALSVGSSTPGTRADLRLPGTIRITRIPSPLIHGTRPTVRPVHPDDDVFLAGTSAAVTELDALLDRASAGEVTVAVVDGPAGVGKSALLRRFRDRHPDVAIVVLGGLPWERSHAGALLGRLLFADGVHPGSHGEPLGSDATDPASAGAALARHWDARAREKPLVVAVDEAQHADPASLRVIVSAVARMRDAQLLLLLARGTGPAAGGDAEVAEILDRLPAVHLRVPPLRPEQVRLLAARVAAVDLPVPVARRLCDHTGGIPRHLLEILRDTPPASWSDWHTPLPVPASAQNRVQKVLDASTPETRALVEAAAVLGPNPTLAPPSVGGVEDPIAALDEASAAGLLRPAAGGASTPSPSPASSCVRPCTSSSLPPGATTCTCERPRWSPTRPSNCATASRPRRCPTRRWRTPSSRTRGGRRTTGRGPSWPAR